MFVDEHSRGHMTVTFVSSPFFFVEKGQGYLNVVRQLLELMELKIKLMPPQIYILTVACRLDL